MRILFGLAVCVRTMKGSKVAAGEPTATEVGVGVLVPHQLLVTLTVPGEPSLVKFFPVLPIAVLPAIRLKCMLNVMAEVGLPFKIPPATPGLPAAVPLA